MLIKIFFESGFQQGLMCDPSACAIFLSDDETPQTAVLFSSGTELWT